ncbi:MAG: hypothetical protein RR367_00970, partial [Clostridia bacterium]
SVLKEEHASELAAMTEEERRVIENSIRKMADMKEEDARQLTLFGRNGYYYWEMERYDPVTLIKTTKAPAYILQGKNDPIVSEHDGWRAYADAIGDVNYVSIKALRGLNHLLMNDTSTPAGQLPTYSIATSLDIQAGKNISNWILGLFPVEDDE